MSFLSYLYVYKCMILPYKKCIDVNLFHPKVQRQVNEKALNVYLGLERVIAPLLTGFSGRWYFLML